MEVSQTFAGSVRVQVSALEDARRAIFASLGDVPAHKRARLSAVIAGELRERGLLVSSLEQYYSAQDVAGLLGRSADWVARMIKRGEFGPCSRDGEWLIPASGVSGYLSRRVFLFSQGSEVAA